MMASLLRKTIIGNPASFRNVVGVLCNASRNHMNMRYKPGPWPKTPEERAAAAKKYGLLPEEYQPYPEDMMMGDYPKLPDIGADSKDPYYPYDFPELKRNFNEPFHASAEIYGEDRFDPSARHRFSNTHMWTWFLGSMTGAFLLYFWLEDYKIGRPVTAKQYPWDGPHYTFSPKC